MNRFRTLHLLFAGMALLGVATPVAVAAQGAPTQSSRYAAADSVPANPAITAVADPGKEPYVTLKLTVPTKDKKGNPVSEITKMTLYRANAVYKTFVPQPGQASITYVDTVPDNHKSYTYGVMATNKFGNSSRVSKSVYVGQQKPRKPDVAIITPDYADHRKASVAWEPPTHDAGNLPIDASTLTYRVLLRDYAGNTTVLQSATRECSCDINYTGDGYSLFSVQVYASNVAGEGAVCNSSNRVFLGDPISANMAESFAGGKTVEPLFTGYQAGTSPLSWVVSTDEAIPGIGSCDNDNGFLAVLGSKNNIGLVSTNYIDVAKFAHPYASMQLYKTPGQPAVELQIAASTDSVAHVIKTIDLRQLPDLGWNAVSADLSDFRGKLPQLTLRVLFKEDGARFYVDNLRVGDAPAADLGIAAIEKLDNVQLGTIDSVSAVVTNYSAAPSAPYTIELLRNGAVVSTREMSPMAPFASQKVHLCHSISPMSADSLFTFSMRLSMDGDSDPANNATEAFTVTAVRSPLPAVTALASHSASSIDITWNAPDMDRMPAQKVSEGFEDYTSFSGNFGQWLNIDGDGRNVGGFSINNEKLPVTGPQAFFVMDVAKYPTFTSTFLFARPGGGSKFASSLYTNDGKPADDWLISPELNGCEQAIEMYVLGYFNFKTIWQVMYSTTGRDTADFRVLADGSYSSTWKKFSYTLPEGARYFAIHANHVGPGSSGPASPLLCVDDISYIPAGKGPGTLVGYNVYVDDKLLTPTPIAATSFKATKPDGALAYKVTAVYDRGESMPATIDATGSAAMHSGEDVQVRGAEGAVIISAPQDAMAEVYSLQGAIVARKAIVAGTNRIDIAPDFYIVRIGSVTEKVVVR